jgi:predicted MFS family arabinose efflux permease
VIDPTVLAPEGAENPPLAIRMGVIAGVAHNVVVGTVMGHFGLMLASAEQRMSVSAGQAALGIPLVLVGASIVAPFAGVIIARYSLRMILLIGALLAVGGFLLLGLTDSFPLYLLAYGLFLGPAMSLTGSIGPATLVTRWFTANRGLALGIVHLPIVIAVLPVPLNWFLELYGHVAAYLTLAAIVAIGLVPLTLLTVDHPPGGEAPAPEPAEQRTADGSFSVWQLLARPRFWAICLAAIASMSSSVLLGSLLVPMGVSWGFSRAESALIQSIMSAVGILGSILFGWLADRLGGARTLAVIAFDCAILWLVLLIQPPFFVTAIVVGLIGMHGAGAIPGTSRAITDAFGQASFSRGFGLNSMIALPFIAFAIIGSAGVYTATGSYAPALAAMAAFFAVAVVLALVASTGRKVEGPQASG